MSLTMQCLSHVHGVISDVIVGNILRLLPADDNGGFVNQLHLKIVHWRMFRQRTMRGSRLVDRGGYVEAPSEKEACEGKRVEYTSQVEMAIA